MRVILTCNFSPWSAYSGGGQRSTHNLATTLARRGHHVTVFFTKAPLEKVPIPRNLAYEVEWAALPWYESKRAIPLRTLVTFDVARRIRRAVRQSSVPVVVHAQGEEAAALVGLRRLGMRFGLIVTPRYPDLPESIRYHPRRNLQTALRMWLFDEKYMSLGIALRGADFCSPPSHYGGDLMRRAYGLRSKAVRPVHNGVPAEFLDYWWQPGRIDRPIVFFGRLDHSKGVDTLIDAVARLGAKAPPKVLLYGRGAARDALERQARASGVAERFEFMGWADHHRLGRALSEASLAVLPSREENFSLAVLSVLAVGTPLITTAVGGTPEVIDDRVHGRLVPAGDAAALAVTLGEARANPQAMAAIARAGRENVRANFTWDANARKFEALYELALRGVS